MARLFYHTMQDNAGNLLLDVTGTMRIAGSGTLATIYGDEALTVILPNPMTNHPSYGSFKCFLGAGDYDFYMAKSGYTFETLTGVQGHGTMAQQDADAVTITGGSAQLGGKATGYWLAAPNGQIDTLYGPQVIDGTLQVGQRTAINGALVGNVMLQIRHNRSTDYGMHFLPLTTALGLFTVGFANAGGTLVGTISASESATAYNTSSDARLKKDVETLTGALDVVRDIRVVSFRWRADDSPGVGFLAQEVAEVVDGVITGERDAVEEDGRVRPQMIDMSKLVPYLTAALKEALAMIDTLSARVASLETQLVV